MQKVMLSRVLALVLLFAAVLPATEAAAVAAPTGFTWSSSYEGYIDDNCDSGDKWTVVIFLHGVGQTPVRKTKICSAKSDFTKVPIEPTAGGTGWVKANDVVSRVKITVWSVVDTCRVRFYRDAGSGGPWVDDYSGIGDWNATHNDVDSSMSYSCV